MSVLRLLRTISHLKARQIIGQVRHRIRRAIENPAKFASRQTHPYPGVHWSPAGDFSSPSAKVFSPDAIAAGTFCFINQTESLGSPVDWQRESLPKLWLYNLHYFEFLWSLPFDQAKHLVSDWIIRHPLRKGAVGWESYPTSLRLMNWCCLFFHQWREETERDPAFRDSLWQSIELQARWLLEHLETHLLGNHYLENAAALTVVGNCFGQSRWTMPGRAILEEQLSEQLLPDGGHFERSPMYHARVVYLLRLLWNIGVMDILPRLEAAETFLGAMTHPDGEIALLNDAAMGIYPADSPASKRLPGWFAFTETGYFGARTADGHYIVCDAAPIGPDYLPGHAHADIFSFELSLFGQRVIVDSGTFHYELSETRRANRSTFAHNTVEIDGLDQAEMWASFRVGRRGCPRDVAFERLEDGFRLTGWHDGYRHLKGSPIHQRVFKFNLDGTLAVEDVIESRSVHRAISRLHVHPSLRVKSVADAAVELEVAGKRIQIVFRRCGQLRMEETMYHPEFNRFDKMKVLVYEWNTLGDSKSGFVIRPVR